MPDSVRSSDPPEKVPPRRLLVVGWDSADWRMIHPLLDAGKLPHLAQLVEAGVIGNIATLQPVYSPMLWTSIATGKRAYRHGIHGFTEPDPLRGGIRPVSNLSRQTKAVWNILSQSGRRCIVVGWWPSFPAEPLPGGVMVSNHFQRTGQIPPHKIAELLPGTVSPPRLARALGDIRLHPSELDGAHLLPFVPKAREIDLEQDKRLLGLAQIITDSTNIQSAATWTLAHEPWDFAAVYFDAIDHFGHGFMKFHPPKGPRVSERDFELYQGVMETGYRYHDLMLGALLAQAGPDVSVMLLSDHGFHPDHLRPKAIPAEPAGPAVEHRPYGIFALAGPGIKRDQRITGATLLDICPTILALFGLPVGRDMDGKVLVHAWEAPPPVGFVDSWDPIAGDSGQHPPGTEIPLADSEEALRQLQALGYIDPLPDNRERVVAECRRELRFNLAQSYMDGQRHHEAAAILGPLWEEWPDEHRFGSSLFSCELALDRLKRARVVLDLLKTRRRAVAKSARAELQKKFAGRSREEMEKLPPKEQHELRRLTWNANASPLTMRWNEAHLLLAEEDHAAALGILKSLEKSGRDTPSFWVQLGRAHLGLERWADAERAYQRALKLDSDHALAHLGLAHAWLGQRRNFEAAGAILTSIGLLYHQPAAHFLLGVTLHRLGRVADAVNALQVCLSLNPNFVPAHQRLALIYEKRLKRAIDARRHRRAVQAIKRRATATPQVPAPVRNPSAGAPPAAAGPRPTPAAPAFAPEPPRTDAAFATVVTGLPRSGTSMMMQMLAAGGLPPLHDGRRAADADNPRGYFEFAPARNLRADQSWLPQASGRALKLVAQLLPALPPATRESYRLVWMERDLDEVLASQAVMLNRLNAAGAALDRRKLRTVFARQLRLIEAEVARRGWPVLKVNYHRCLGQPAAVAAELASFLGLPLDCVAMAAAVDPALHRQRT
ncbi:MAG TPA: alkaline phosphatase family protein [Opitutus sp.]|nr:alkaline phosphatase family protein [Opitutus sp.]